MEICDDCNFRAWLCRKERSTRAYASLGSSTSCDAKIGDQQPTL